MGAEETAALADTVETGPSTDDFVALNYLAPGVSSKVNKYKSLWSLVLAVPFFFFASSAFA